VGTLLRNEGKTPPAPHQIEPITITLEIPLT
jgi:hypothetical protein